MLTLFLIQCHEPVVRIIYVSGNYSRQAGNLKNQILV